jgi:hypothetical protein
MREPIFAGIVRNSKIISNPVVALSIFVQLPDLL